MEKEEYAKRIGDLEEIIKEKDRKIQWLEGVNATLERKVNVYNTVLADEIVDKLKDDPNAFDIK